MKTVTKWKTRSGYDTVTPDNSGFSLLLEDGFNLLLEAGGELLLESSEVTPKIATAWTTPAKNRTSWEARDGFSTLQSGTPDDMMTEAGDARVTEAGDTRVFESVTMIKKKPTAWSEG